MLLGHRYYDPSAGRFLSRDPAQDGRNWYAYCDGSPTNGIDPGGYYALGNGWTTAPGSGSSDSEQPSLLIIVGALGGQNDIRPGALRLINALEESFSSLYRIKLVPANYPEDITRALSEADAAIMIGHGAPFCTKHGRAFTTADVFKAAKRRRKNEKEKLDFLLVYSCDMLDSASVTAYGHLTNHLFGFDDHTYCYPDQSADELLGAGGHWFDNQLGP